MDSFRTGWVGCFEKFPANALARIAERWNRIALETPERKKEEVKARVKELLTWYE
jgi:hypothetical protein